jgi:hypothetical protein
MKIKGIVTSVLSALVIVGASEFPLDARPIDAYPQVARPGAQQPRSDEATSIYIGPGGLNCGRWTEDRAAGKTRALDDVLKWWAAGFLHGVTMTLGVAQPEGSADAILSQLALYCAANPEAVISEAGLVVLKGMMNQPQRLEKRQ